MTTMWGSMWGNLTHVSTIFLIHTGRFNTITQILSWTIIFSNISDMNRWRYLWWVMEWIDSIICCPWIDYDISYMMNSGRFEWKYVGAFSCRLKKRKQKKGVSDFNLPMFYCFENNFCMMNKLCLGYIYLFCDLWCVIIHVENKSAIPIQ